MAEHFLHRGFAIVAQFIGWNPMHVSLCIPSDEVGSIRKRDPRKLQKHALGSDFELVRVALPKRGKPLLNVRPCQ